MRKWILGLIILIFISGILSTPFAQPNLPFTTKPAEIPDKDKTLMNGFLPKTIGSWKILEPGQYFDRRTIFDYMNGTGELYRSYSYRYLLVRQYKSEQKEEPWITVEIFDMGSSADAFGVFSFEQMDDPVGIGQGSVYGGGMLRFWKNRYFVNIYPEFETATTRQVILTLGRKIATVIKENGSIPKLVFLIPKEKLINKTIRYFHLYSELDHHYFVSDKNILLLDEHTEAIMARYQFDKHKLFLLIVHYSDETIANQAFHSFIGACNTENGYQSSKNGLFSIQKTATGKLIFVKEEKGYLSIIFDAINQSNAEHLLNSINP